MVGISNELSQVIINILQNAKDAFLQNECKEKTIKIKVAENCNNVYIKIEDNAGGIENSIIERIFEPYFTTKHASKGTGLGLFMSKLIIEKSFEGTIEVSNIKNGACFTITLPLYKSSIKES